MAHYPIWHFTAPPSADVDVRGITYYDLTPVRGDDLTKPDDAKGASELAALFSKPK